MLRKLLVIGTFLVFIFTGLKGNAEQTEYNYEMVMTEEENVAATIRIRTISEFETRSGSGVVWDITEDGKLIILTAKHCVDEYKTVITELVFANEETCYVYDFYLCPDKDIAFVVVDCATVPEDAMASLREVIYDGNITDQRGMDAYTIGRHNEEGVVYFSGKCNSYEADKWLSRLCGDYCFSTDYPVIPGTSGGGIYNQAGYLLGITSKGAEGYSSYESIEFILEYAERAFGYGEGYGCVDLDYFR